MTDETMVRIVDAILLHFAEQIRINHADIPIDQATACLWTLLEEGRLRLASADDEHLGVESCGENRAERRAQARKNRRLIEMRRMQLEISET